MSIPVIDTIKPLGNFPAIDSVDVNCDGIRLNTVLSTTAIELAKKINAEAVENTYAKKTDIPVVPTNVSEFINDAGYLTEHQSLAAYALKSELPTVPKKVSDFENDADYVTAQIVNAKFNNIPFYNVTEYGINPNTGDIYDGLWDFLNDVVKTTGGIVYFPAGKYTISDTIFIPENTTFMGNGKDTEIYFDETHLWFGAGLSNAGSNVKICNMTVTQKSTDKFINESQPGCIGFTDVGLPQYTKGKHATSAYREEVKNLTVENCWFGNSKYAIQTEPSNSNNITNVFYRNIVSLKGCVSVDANGESDNNTGVINATVENVDCDFLRIRESGTRNVRNVRCSNIKCNTFYVNANSNGLGGIIIENLEQTGFSANNTFPSGLVAGNVTFNNCHFKNHSSKTNGIEMGLGVHRYNNCHFEMTGRLISRLRPAADIDISYMYAENCTFDLNDAIATSFLIGYGRNNRYNSTPHGYIANLLYGDTNIALENANLCPSQVSATHTNKLSIVGNNVFLSVYSVVDGTANLMEMSNKFNQLPFDGAFVPVLIFENANRATTQINTYAKFHNGILELVEPEILTKIESFDRVMIHSSIEFLHIPSPYEMYKCFYANLDG